MNDLEREKKRGLSLWYLKDMPLKRLKLRGRHQTPGFGLAAQLFACLSEVILERLGPEAGEDLIREAVQRFGRRRGERIAARVKEAGLPLSFKNWLIHTDIAGSNFPVRPRCRQGALIADVGGCSFITAAKEWGMEGYAALYCKYADHAILGGYNPDINLDLTTRHITGEDHCRFCYSMESRGTP